MAITDKTQGVWDVDQVFNKQNQGSIWPLPSSVADPYTLWAWGQNNSGELAQNNQTQYSSPVQIGSETDWDSVTSFYQSAAALRKDTTP